MSNLGKFDLIFIRNVMIYFDDKTRQKIINGLQQLFNQRWLPIYKSLRNIAWFRSFF